MKHVFEKSLKQSVIALLIVILVIVCSNIFGSISVLSKTIDQASNSAHNFNDKISTTEEIGDVEGYANIIYGIGSGFSYFSVGLFWIIKILMQVIPIALFISVALSNLISYLFNLGKEQKWKKITGIVFWVISLIKLIAIAILLIILLLGAMLYVYISVLLIICISSIVYQIWLMVKNKQALKIAD